MGSKTFTYHYSQPSEYQFSLDSILLAEFVANKLNEVNVSSQMKVLDLCAGCGVIGFEFAWHCPQVKNISFVEVQEAYQTHFFKNLAIVNRSEMNFQWHLLNYDKLTTPAWTQQFDLIISNPPYFHANQGMLSPSEFKNRCRFYLDSSFENFILAIQNTLKYTGEAYFLLRSLQQHNYDAMAKIADLKLNLRANIVGNIRGTPVVSLKYQQ